MILPFSQTGMSDYEFMLFLQKWTESKGIFNQIFKAAEESAELSAALNRYCQSMGHYSEVVEEMADVYIMLEQLRLIFRCNDQLEVQIKFKLSRMKESWQASQDGAGKSNRECNSQISQS